MGLAFSLIVSG